MKNKIVNILFSIFITYLMIFNMKDVYAEKASICTYNDGSRNIEVEFSEDGKYMVDANKPAVKIKAGNVNDSIFKKEGKNPYCPNKLYLNYVKDVYDEYGFGAYSLYEFALEKGTVDPNSKIPHSNEVLTLVDTNADAVTYNPIEDENGKLILCDSNEEFVNESLEYVGKLSDIVVNKEKYSSDELKKIAKEIQSFSDRVTSEDKNNCFKYNPNFEDLVNLAFKGDGKETGFKGIENLAHDKCEDEFSDEQEIKKCKGEITEVVEETIEDIKSKTDFEFQLPTTNKIYDCEGLITDELEAVIQLALKVLRIAAPILLIVLCTVDFSLAVISNDKEALSKATSKVVKRAIAALVIYLVPLFVSVAIGWIETQNTGENCLEVIE